MKGTVSVNGGPQVDLDKALSAVDVRNKTREQVKAALGQIVDSMWDGIMAGYASALAEKDADAKTVYRFGLSVGMRPGRHGIKTAVKLSHGLRHVDELVTDPEGRDAVKGVES